MDEDQRSGSSDLTVAQQPGIYNYADQSHSQSLSFRTGLVAKKRITGSRGAIRDSYSAPIAENVSVNTILVDASHRDAMAVAATIANQLEMDRRDAIGQATVYLLKPTMRKDCRITAALDIGGIGFRRHIRFFAR